jgi:hypothetical protein
MGGLGGGMGRGLGIGGTVVVLALSLLFGRNLFSDLGVEPGIAATNAPLSAADSAAQEEQVQFVSFVLDDVQNTWAKILPNYGAQFHPARLVLFRNSTSSGCGGAQSAMGPFYCPEDERVYLDLGFFDELQQKFGASGDFARAYVIAHELGHHVQHLLGTDAPRAAGRLLCRSLGSLDGSATDAADGRCRRGIERRGFGRRRPHPAGDDGPHQRRFIYSRLCRAKVSVVQARIRVRRSEELQHALIRGAAAARM